MSGVLNAPLGRAVVEILGAKSVVIGRDARLTDPELRDALALDLSEAGAQVTDNRHVRHGRNLLCRRQPTLWRGRHDYGQPQPCGRRRL